MCSLDGEASLSAELAALLLEAADALAYEAALDTVRLDHAS
jgi:hypothetical protein